MFLLADSTHRMLIQHDPDVGHRFVPNLRARLPNETGGYFLVTNSLGFRSDIEFEKRLRGKPRILMFGDSYTAGDNCANEDRYSDRLARNLDVEVYNYGVSGTGTDQHLLTYRKFASDVEANLIIVCVQVESIERIQASHRESIDRVSGERVLVPKPYFTLEEGNLVLHQTPVPKERPSMDAVDDESWRGSDQPNDWKASALRWYRENPRAAQVRKWMRNDIRRLKSEIYRLGNLQPFPDLESETSPGWRLMKAILTAFIDETAPVPVLIVPIPTYHFYEHGVKPTYQGLFEGLADKERRVHVLDVSHPLGKLAWDERQRLSFRVGGHFTPFANDKVAEMMAAAIRTHALVPEAARKPSNEPTSISSRRVVQREPGSTFILGISCFYHNSAACLIKDGDLVAAAEEERFTRVKHDRRFPTHALNYCLEEGGVDPDNLDAVVFYENTSLTFERILHSALAMGQEAEDSWLRFMPSWVRYKLRLPQLIREYMNYEGLILQGIHHRSHCASAFYPSPFRRAAILTIDGVGEWATASVGLGRENELQLLKEMHFPHSLGLLYSAFTQFVGFKVNSGEYKMMGLAPFGQPKYTEHILENIVDLKEDGSLELNLEFFDFLRKPSMASARFAELFDGPPRAPESTITRREMDIARSIQAVTEESILRMARHAHRLTGEERLCLAGGVALNCVANGRVLREGPFDDIWIQPAAGDAGCALGAALDAYHSYFGNDRRTDGSGRSPQRGSYWGPSFSDDEIRCYLETFGFPYTKMDDQQRADYLARALSGGKVVGHFSDRMEYGPRALGSRSILGDARNQSMQAELNLKIKYRESFRPFAPTVLKESVQDYFELDRESPYMLIVAPVRPERRKKLREMKDDDMLAFIRQERSDVPAITHVDYSARVQTIAQRDHPDYYRLISRFEELTGCGLVVNTSFNVRGEPIVCTPADAYRCFMRTGMNVLVLGNYVLLKEEQPQWPEGKAEGLEAATVTLPEVDADDDPLVEELRSMFRDVFLPIANDLNEQHAVQVDVRFKRRDTGWSDFNHDREINPLFELPAALDAAEPDPVKFAAAMTSCWNAGSATEALRDVVRQLVLLNQRFPANVELEEEVPESVYVLF